jgi:hypothetical protein
MPFFPRVLIHLVGLDRSVVQRQGVGRLQGRGLEPVPESQQVLAVPVQFTGQPRGGLALGDPPEDEEDLGGSPMGLVEGGAGEEIEHPAAAVTAVVEDRGAVPPVDLQGVAGLTARAGEAVGVEDIDKPLVAGILVHELGDGEVHGGPRCSHLMRDPDPPSLPRGGNRLE